jgi:hypothetical protein
MTAPPLDALQQRRRGNDIVDLTAGEDEAQRAAQRIGKHVELANPPRERFWSPLSGRGLLVRADQGGVEHQILILAILGENLEDALPGAVLGPACEAGMHALPLAVSRRQVMPMRAGTQHPKNGVDEQAIIASRPAGIAHLAGKQRLDPLPLRVREFVPLDYRPCSESINLEHKESSRLGDENLECRLDLVGANCNFEQLPSGRAWRHQAI